MYRIELSPGEETVFRTIEELAVAIRRNVVTSKARIYHTASSKWLPIQFHPHYKLAVSMPLTQADLVAGPPVKPLSSLQLGEAHASPPAAVPSSRETATQAALAAWPAPKPISTPPAKPAPAPVPRQPIAQAPQISLGTPAPEPRRTVQPARMAEPARKEPARKEPARVVQPARPAPARAKSSRKRRKAGRSLHLALAGAVLAACAQLLISAASSGPSEFAARIHNPRRLIEAPIEALIAAPIEAMKEDSPRTVAGVLPALQTIRLPRKASSIKPKPTVRKPASAASKPAANAPAAPAIDSASPEIQPAPAAGDLSGSPVAPVPVTSKVVDSTGKKALHGILRTIGGTPAPESKTPKP